jgi:hypothetical protein
MYHSPAGAETGEEDERCDLLLPSRRRNQEDLVFFFSFFCSFNPALAVFFFFQERNWTTVCFLGGLTSARLSVAPQLMHWLSFDGLFEGCLQVTKVCLHFLQRKKY